MKKIIQYIPFLLILSVSTLLFIKVNQNEKNAGDSLFGESPMMGKQVVDYELEKILPEAKEGKISTASFKAGYTVLNLFASWCTACLYEHKFIKDLKYVDGLNLVGVAWRDKKEDALKWLEKNGNPYKEVGLDVSGKFGILMGVTGIPETFLIDPKGVIVMHFARTVTENDIEDIKKEIEKK